LPRQLRRVALGGDLDLAAAGVEPVVAGLHLERERPVHRVVLEQMRVGLDRAEVVDADDLDVAALGFAQRAQHQSADAAEAVNPDPDRHGARLRWSQMSFFAAAATASAVIPKCL